MAAANAIVLPDAGIALTSSGGADTIIALPAGSVRAEAGSAMNFKMRILLACMLTVAFAASAGAKTPIGDEALRKQAVAYLVKAEQEARKASDEKPEGYEMSPKDDALALVACGYIGLDNRKAKVIAAELPKSRQGMVEMLIVQNFARKGDIDRAITEARACKQKDNSVGALSLVVSVCANQNRIARALKIAETLPASHRDLKYSEIAKLQVLSGDLDGAEKTIRKISNAEMSGDIKELLDVAKLVARGGDLCQAIAKAKADAGALSGRFLTILMDRASDGDLKEARRILKVLSDWGDRATALNAIADAQLRKGDKAACLKTLEGVRPEIRKLQKSDPDFAIATLQLAGICRKKARLLVAAGDLDEAVKTIRVADHAAEEESRGGLGIVKAMGRSTIVGMMAQTGRLDEAVKMATGKDGKIDPKCVTVLAMGYAEQGDMKKANELMGSQASPSTASRLYLAAAAAMMEKLNKKKTPKKNGQPKWGARQNSGARGYK